MEREGIRRLSHDPPNTLRHAHMPALQPQDTPDVTAVRIPVPAALHLLEMWGDFPG